MAKRKIKEQGNYEVDMVNKQGPGSKNVSKTTKTVQAGSEEEALRKASQGSTGSEEYVVRKTKPEAGAPAAGATGVSMEGKGGKTRSKTSKSKKKPKIDPQTMEMLESATYPYSIMLPLAFEEVYGKLNESYTTSRGYIYHKIPDQKAMVEFVTKLSTSKDRRSKVVLDGIKESLNS